MQKDRKGQTYLQVKTVFFKQHRCPNLLMQFASRCSIMYCTVQEKNLWQEKHEHHDEEWREPLTYKDTELFIRWLLSCSHNLNSFAAQ